jgi:hypothetical protein
MNLIFYGFLVMLLGIDVSGISLGPLFQIGGYALVMQGMQAIDKNNPYFKRALPLVYALMALNAASFVMDVANVVALSGIIGLATGIISLITVYNIIKGIQVYRDELQTPNLTTKLFKRWRLSVILFVVAFVVIIIGAVIVVVSVPFAAVSELFAQLQLNPSSEAIALQLGELIAPVFGVMFGVLMATIILIVSAMVFYIMFLVTLYNVQKEFALRTPAISTPTDFPNPQ